MAGNLVGFCAEELAFLLLKHAKEGGQHVEVLFLVAVRSEEKADHPHSLPRRELHTLAHSGKTHIEARQPRKPGMRDGEVVTHHSRALPLPLKYSLEHAARGKVSQPGCDEGHEALEDHVPCRGSDINHPGRIGDRIQHSPLLAAGWRRGPGRRKRDIRGKSGAMSHKENSTSFPHGAHSLPVWVLTGLYQSAILPAKW